MNDQGCTPTCTPTCNTAHRRITLEEKVIRRFIREAKLDGWLPFAVMNGEETVSVNGERQTIVECGATDECAIRFRHTARNVRSHVLIIRGNGVDVLADCGSLLESVYDRVTDITETWSN